MGFKLGKNKVSIITEYKYFPKDKNELREILYERLKEDPNADLNDIDVSKIYDMLNLFKRFDPHDIDISEWNMSNVKEMNEMFRDCKNFKGDGLENWNVQNVRHMVMTFEGCKNLNCDLSRWDVSKVEDMAYMFFGCEKFNSDLSKWNVSNVEYMQGMFNNCKHFEGKGLEKWNVKNVESMNDMFGGCESMENTPSWYSKSIS